MQENKSYLGIGAVAVVFVLAPSPAHAQQSRFDPLAVLPGWTYSNAGAISRDGTTVVGNSGDRPCRWRAPDSPEEMISLEGVGFGVSGDGSVASGWYTSPLGGRGFRWSEADGVLTLMPLPQGGTRFCLTDRPGRGCGGICG
jgi:hypothetical protein